MPETFRNIIETDKLLVEAISPDVISIEVGHIVRDLREQRSILSRHAQIYLESDDIS